MSLEKVPVSRVIKISLDANNAITHAWQETTYSIRENGEQITTQDSAAENIEPSGLQDLLPQADVMRQLSDEKAAAAAAADAATRLVADRDGQIKALQDELAALKAIHAAAVDHLTAAAATLTAPSA